eukprot:TRINITY_DN11841_c0_g1_i1.p1 TRINITY_DN11841_c0_g1~~TRINITY_DN11841_c0_g1_i1.p1  ORF type:complete len:338 (+),score=36.41 TRINITY_DN11841_c0_g1_i1:117-1130(+)
MTSGQSSSSQQNSTKIQKPPPASPLVNFIAGGCGGALATLITCPLEVIKTRLQASTNAASPFHSKPFGMRIGYGLWSIAQQEGVRGLWKGLGPNLLGVAPSRAIHFMTYMHVKKLLTEQLGFQESNGVYLISAAAAGTTVMTIMSPVWLVKTRMQLQTSKVGLPADGHLPYRNSLDCVVRVFREEGVRGFYKGLVASYIGVSETAIQFWLYERFKAFWQDMRFSEANPGLSLDRDKASQITLKPWEYLTVASVAKLIASAATYPHEVIRTRIREQRASEPGKPHKYTGFFQALRVIAREEGVRGLYGGMGAHLLRVVPNAAIMFLTFETVARFLSNS